MHDHCLAGRVAVGERDLTGVADAVHDLVRKTEREMCTHAEHCAEAVTGPHCLLQRTLVEHGRVRSVVPECGLVDREREDFAGSSGTPDVRTGRTSEERGVARREHRRAEVCVRLQVTGHPADARRERREHTTGTDRHRGDGAGVRRAADSLTGRADGERVAPGWLGDGGAEVVAGCRLARHTVGALHERR